MSLACAKSYSLTVAVPIPTSAYWKLDEAAGSVPRVASVGGCNLAPAGITDVGFPGLINLCVRFDGVFGGAGYNSPATASLGHVLGNSFSLFGWAKLDATGGAAATGGPCVRWGLTGTRFIRFSVGSNTDPTPWRIDSFHDTAYVSLTVSDWHFFFIFWDATLQQWGYSFDNGPQSLLPTVEAIGNVATGSVQLQNNFNSGIDGTMFFDEIGIVTTERLDLAQLAFLYNGGAGRTYPF